MQNNSNKALIFILVGLVLASTGLNYYLVRKLATKDHYVRFFQHRENPKIDNNAPTDETSGNSAATGSESNQSFLPCYSQEHNVLSKIMNIEEEFGRVAPIPYQGILGGVTHVSGFRILSDQWVYADCSDGHFIGYALYEYSIEPGNKLSMKILIKDLMGE